MSASIKEFPVELHRLSAILQDDKGEWERRLAALQQLRSVFEQDPSSHPDYLNLMSQLMRLTLKEQIEDLRSSISKEACTCVKSLCICTGANWEPLSSWFCAALLGNTCATVAVIADAAEDALATITSCGVVSTKALNAYLQGAIAKHSTVRRNSFASLLRILTHSESHFVAKNAVPITKAIRTGLTDAVQGPRQLARLCFWGLEAVCKDQAEVLFNGCEAAIQRTIQQEQGTFFVWMQQGKLPESCCPTKRGITQRGNTNQAPACATNTSRLKHAPSPSEVPQEEVRAPSPQQREKSVEKKSFLTRSRPVSHNTNKTTTSKPSAASNHVDPASHIPFSQISSTTAMAPPSGRTAPPPRQRSVSAHRKEVERKPAVSKTNSMASRPRTAATGRGTGLSSQQQQQQPTIGNPSHHSSDDSWHEIVTAASSHDWSQRVTALGSIGELLELGALAHTQDAFALVMEKVNDSHFKVATAAFHTLQRFLDMKPDAVCPSLERLLITLFPKLTDQKLKEAARSTVEVCGTAFGPEILFPVLAKIVESTNQRIRPGCLEFLAHLAGGHAASKYFTNGTSLKLVAGKLITVLFKEKTQTHLTLIRGTLAQLYQYNPHHFVIVVSGLQPPEQASLFEHLKAKIPHLAQDCRRQANGERALNHPPTGNQSTTALNAGFKSPTKAAASPAKSKLKTGQHHALQPESRFERPEATGFAEMNAAAANFGATLPSASPQHRHKSLSVAAAMSPTQGPSMGPGGVFSPGNYDPTTAANTDRFGDVVSPTGGVNKMSSLSPQVTIGGSRTGAGHGRSPGTNPNSRLADPLLSPGNGILRIQELMLLRNAVTVEERREAIRVAANSLQTNETLWLEHYSKFLPFALAFARETDHGLRVMSFRWLRSIAAADYLQPSNEQALEHFVRAAHSGIDDAFPEVRTEGAALAYDSFAKVRPASTVVALLTLLEDDEVVSRSSGKALTFLIDEVGKAIGHVGAAEDSAMWCDYLPKMVNAVARHADSPETDVRKAVVLALVDFFLANHEALLPLIAGLPPAKLRLLEMYINKGGRDGVRPVEPVVLSHMMQERHLVGRAASVY